MKWAQKRVLHFKSGRYSEAFRTFVSVLAGLKARDFRLVDLLLLFLIR